jgi:transketolase
MEATAEFTNLPATYDDLDVLAANIVRGLAMDGVQKAESGHPGMPMGMGTVAEVLWTRFLRHNPADPEWYDRDRFVLSGGHGSMLLYSLLHLSGYALPLEQLKNFRQLGSMTPGHPEYDVTPGVETTTGPLGQGLGNAAGMALAEAFLAATFNRPGYQVVSHYTYVFGGDGDLEEGISHEACSLAGHLRLGKLIFFYDDNKISIDGPTSLSYTDNVPLRFLAYGWHVQDVDAYDMPAIDAAIRAAQAETGRPSIIICHSHIGYGSPNKQDTAKAHGEPLGVDEVKLTKVNLGLPPDEQFYVPEDALVRWRTALALGKARQAAWNELMRCYGQDYPAEFESLRAALRRELPAGWDAALPGWEPGSKLATRAASGKVLDAIAPLIPTLIGGSADLTPSNNTRPKDAVDVKPGDYQGRYIRFGIREHGMGAMLNGMALHGGVFPYGGTFQVFSDYMRPTARLAAIMQAPVTFVWTHDSVGVGEDGPTHQPIEQTTSLRAIPDLVIIRPADANETAAAWRYALTHRRPVGLLLSRQNLTVLPNSKEAAADGRAMRGAYIVADAPAGQPDVILIGTGSEVGVALAAREQLAQEGIQARVVSMPSWELFDEQDTDYHETVLPASVSARVSVEAGITLGWERYTGSAGASVGIDRFGASGKGPAVMAYLGITPEHVAAEARRVSGK